MPALCPILDVFTSEHATKDAIRNVVCKGPEHGDVPSAWEPTEITYSTPSSGGIGAELEKYGTNSWPRFSPTTESCDTAMLRIVSFVGILKQLQRSLSGCGHAWRDPEHAAHGYSMPAYLASQLKELERKGHLPLTWGPAEGPGAYNVMISHWILAGSGSTTA